MIHYGFIFQIWWDNLFLILVLTIRNEVVMV
jgi:predicted secreted protein